MKNWFDDLPGVTGALTLDSAQLVAWPDRAMDARLSKLRFCPVLPRELYQIARHLPLVVVDQPGGQMVMAELAPNRLRQPAFDTEGRYLRSYRPQVSQLLPFCTALDGTLLRLSDEVAPSGPERPEYLRQQIVQMLRAQAAGISRMAAAAAVLVEEGLLIREADKKEPVWNLSPPDLETETAGAAANLPAVPESFLALRLLGVLEFSSIHRREHHVRRSDSDSLRELLGRNEALKRKTFLTRDELLDFSALPQLSAPPPAEGES